MNRSLFIIDATGEESRFDMTQETLIVGRDAPADLTLQDNRISRRHLCLTQVSGDLVVEELKSSNGTTLNGEAFEGKRILKAGDRLDLGGIQIHIDLVRGTGKPSVRPKSTRRTKSPIPVALMILAVAAVATYSLRQTEPTTPSASTSTAESPPSDNPSVDTNGTTSTDTGTGAGERFVTDRKLADARVDLRLMVEEAILEENLPSAAQALERFEKLHGARSARTARSHLIAASTALLNRSLSEWQHLQSAFSADDRQTWLANKERSFPQRSTDFAKLQDAVISWAANPIPTTSTPESNASSPIATSTPESNTQKPNPTVAAAPHASLIQQAAEQESARRYASAAELWTAAFKAAQLENTGRRSQLHAKAQSRRLTLQASAIVSMTQSINQQPGQFTNLRCFSQRRGNAVRATENGVDFLVGEKPVALTWKAIRNDCLVDIIRRCKLTIDELLPCAQLLLSMKQDDRAHKFLQNAVKIDAALLESVGQLLSDHLGMDLPTGNFCWIEGRYLSPREARRVATRTSITMLVADIASDDENERRSAAEKLFALGASAQSTFHRALMEEKKRIFKAIEGSKTFQRLETMGGRATELRTRRRSVLDLVFDTHLYPYPYRGFGQEVRKRYQETQQKIDELKVGVREIWDVTTSVHVGPKFRANLARVSELNQWLESLELGRGGNDPEFLLYLPSSEAVNIRTFALDNQERERIDDSLLAVAENATRKTAASVSEARQVELTNIYRVMMGRRAVRIHDILTRSVRGHCQDMARLGFFGHMNDKEPEKRTPSDRARLMGFDGGVSENLAINSGAQGAHNAWIHSSGHHRNILGRTHRIMGAGNSGKRWGQVFSGQEPERLAPDDDIEDADDDS